MKTKKKETRPKVSKRTRYMSIVAGVILIATAPSWAPIDSSGTLKQNAQSDRAQAETLLRQANEANSVLMDPDSFDARRNRLEAAVPDGPDLPGVIDAIGRTAAASGLQWTTANPSRSDSLDQAYQSWSMNITVTGDRAGLTSFLDGIRSLERYITIDTITYQQLNDAQVSLIATVRFYSLATDDALSSPIEDNNDEIDSIPVESGAASEVEE